MRNLGSALVLAWALCGAIEASAAEGAADAPVPDEPTGRLMRPGNLDLRVTGDTDVLLVYVDFGLGGDFGLLPLGPGTLSLGGEFDVGVCVSACLLLNAVTNLRWGSRFFTPFVRAAYHFPIQGARTLQKADLYGLLMAGPVIASTGISSADGTISATGQDTAFGVGLGGGGNYFVTDRLFVGLEARMRYARGVYKFTFQAGSFTFTEQQQTWDLSGVNILVFLGLRL